MAVRPLPQTGITGSAVNYTAPSFDASQKIDQYTQQDVQFLKELRQEQMRSEEAVSEIMSKVNPMELWNDAGGYLSEMQSTAIQQSIESARDIMESKKGLLNSMDLANIKKGANSVLALQATISGVEKQAQDAIKLSQKDDTFDSRASAINISKQFQDWAKNASQGNMETPQFLPIIRSSTFEERSKQMNDIVNTIPTAPKEVIVSSVVNGKEVKTKRTVDIPTFILKEGLNVKDVDVKNPWASIDRDKVNQLVDLAISESDINEAALLKLGDSAISINKNTPLPERVKQSYIELTGEASIPDEFPNTPTGNALKREMGRAMYRYEQESQMFRNWGFSYSERPEDEGSSGGGKDKPLIGKTGLLGTTLTFNDNNKNDNNPIVKVDRKVTGFINTKDLYIGTKKDGTPVTGNNFTAGVQTSVPVGVVGVEKIGNIYYAQVDVSPTGDEEEGLVITTEKTAISSIIKDDTDGLGKFLESKIEEDGNDYNLRFGKGDILLVPLDNVSNTNLSQADKKALKDAADKVERENKNNNTDTGYKAKTTKTGR